MTPRKTAKAANGLKLAIEPMKMTCSFVTGFCARKLGRRPSPKELVQFTKDNPDLFPKPWSLKGAKWALDNPNELLLGGES
jgi:hypothetical protein